MRVRSTPRGGWSSGSWGTFTFRSVSWGNPVDSTQCASRRANSAEASKANECRPISETAIDGTPSSVPSMAALTVPE